MTAQGHVHVMNLAVLTEYLSQVVLGDVLGQSLDHNLFVKSVMGAAGEG